MASNGNSRDGSFELLQHFEGGLLQNSFPSMRSASPRMRNYIGEQSIVWK